MHHCVTLLVLLPIALVIADGKKEKGADPNGCHKFDHEACDEICKQDGYWYGHCARWDGRDFQCKCYEYQQPLKGDVCKTEQRKCTDDCFKSGHIYGGYCYPHPTAQAPYGDPRCRCFEELPFIPDDSSRKRR